MQISGDFENPDWKFWTVFMSALANDDGSAAKNRLAAGKAIYTREADTPPSHVIKTYPDGRRELLFVANDGTPHVVRAL